MKKLVIILPIMFICSIAYADNCVNELYTVHYSCGDGSGMPPADKVATYNQTFTHNAFAYNKCTAPSGKVFAGFRISSADKAAPNVVVRKLSDFDYLYTSDIFVTALWAGVPTPDIVWANVLDNGRTTYRYSGASRTWSNDFYWGRVSGIAACSNNKIYAKYPMVVPADVEIVDEGGVYCYCRVTSPYSEKSPWVYNDKFEPASDCPDECAKDCANNLGYGVGIMNLNIFSGFKNQ